jgi:hypothetical protein
MSSIVLAVLLGAIVVNASPSLNARQSITALTTSQIDTFTTYTYYASAGYCTNTQTLAWDCGSECSHAFFLAGDLGVSLVDASDL